MTAFPDFFEFFAEYSRLLVREARRIGEDCTSAADIQTDAWLAWEEACASWNPARATAPTWIVRRFTERMMELTHGADPRNWRGKVQSLDADEADFAAPVDQDLPASRTAELGAAQEDLAGILSRGTAALADELGKSQRCAQQRVVAILRPIEAGQMLLDF